jgi:hypothetical protein
MKTDYKINLLIIAILIVISFLFRYFLISDNKFLFLFDQSRDAYLSRTIVDQHKLKLQGPSASGTNDKIYHGVMHYYIVGPIYSLFNGNPLPVAITLILLGSLTVIPLFLLVKYLSNSTQIAIISCILFAISYQSTELVTWIANPSYTLLTITFFYLFLWLVCFQNKVQYLPLLLLSLGICNQSGIYTLYLWISIFAAFIFIKKFDSFKFIKENISTVIVSCLLYLISISSIIITQILLIKRGVTTGHDASLLVGGSRDIMEILNIIFKAYINNLSMPIFPSFKILSLIVGILTILFVIYKANNSIRTFLLIWLLSPLFLLYFQPRNIQQYLIALTPFLYVIISLFFGYYINSLWSRILLILFLLLYIHNNVIQAASARQQGYQLFSMQQGAFLKDQLNTIDYTYKIADNKPFSISTLTIPYSYNTTWSYLYNWYGKQNYGYLPSFYGPSQKGLFAGDLLSEATSPG